MFNFTTIRLPSNGKTYIRLEDVADLIEELVATEDTDVRNHFEQVIRDLRKLENKSSSSQ